MPRPYTSDAPDTEGIELRLLGGRIAIKQFVSYTFGSDFLTPSDAFTFALGDDALPEEVNDALRIGARVSLVCNGAYLAVGHIDSVEVAHDRRSGTQYTVHGRNQIALAVDAVADPTLQFKEGTTLEEMVVKLFSPFGWSDKGTQFKIDNDANRAVKTGGDRGIKMSKGGKKGPKPLKDFVLHQLKPHNHEGVFAFAARTAERFGLWIWGSADGDHIILGRPDFTQTPTFRIERRKDGSGNVESGRIKFDGTTQPTILFADGYAPGTSEYGGSSIKAFCVNPYFGVDEQGFVLDALMPLMLKQPDAVQIMLTTTPFKRRKNDYPIRPLYLHDPESKTQEQLEAFVRREMSLHLRKSLTVEYTVQGHGQYDKSGNFVVWAVDTTVEVIDEAGGVNETMWVLGVRFEKSRRGTYTRLHLIRLHSIQFVDTEGQKVKMTGAQANAMLDPTGKAAEKWLQQTAWIPGIKQSPVRTALASWQPTSEWMPKRMFSK